MAEGGIGHHSTFGTRRLIEESGRLAEVGVLALIVTIAVLAIAEIGARQQFLALIAGQIEEKQSAIIDQTAQQPRPDEQDAQQPRRDEQDAQQPSPVEQETQQPWPVEQGAERLVRLRDELSSLRYQKSRTESLIAIGAQHSSQTLEELRFDRNAFPQVEPPEEHTGSVVSLGLRAVGLQVEYLSVDHLLALSIITCGAIGALIGSIRNERRLTFKYLSLGFSSGFVTFLAIKGGKHIFLVSSGADSTFFNPYSSAFAGLLAGLFTERAYQLLSSVVDQLAKRLEQAMK